MGQVSINVNPIVLSRKIFQTMFLINESAAQDKKQVHSNCETNFNKETQELQFNQLACWLDEFIKTSLEQETQAENIFSEYTKNIFSSIQFAFDIKATDYNQANKDNRVKYIKSILRTVTDSPLKKQIINQSEKENHFTVYKFLDQAIEVLTRELEVKALMAEYLNKDDDESKADYNFLLEELLTRSFDKSFSHLEPLFHQEFLKRNKEEQQELIQLLNASGYSFDPSEDYYSIAKSVFLKRLESVEGLDPYDIFNFCSSIPQDIELQKICFENLRDNEDINSCSAELNLLAKLQRVELDTESLATLQNLLDNDEENLFTQSILKILMNSNLEEIFPNPKLEKDLLNILLKYENEFESESKTESNLDIDKQTVLTLLLLSKINNLSSKTLEGLNTFANDTSNKLSKASSALIRNLNPEAKIDFDSLNNDFDILRNFSKAKSEDELIEVKKSLIKLALSFTEDQSLKDSIQDYHFNKIITAKRMPYFLNSQSHNSNAINTFNQKRTVFSNLLIHLSNAKDKGIRELALNLFPLFPNQLINKAFQYISGSEDLSLNALGVSVLDYFTEGKNQYFLNNYLKQHPEAKENFHITKGYNEMREKAVFNEAFSKRIEHLESTLRALGFKFKMAA